MPGTAPSSTALGVGERPADGQCRQKPLAAFMSSPNEFQRYHVPGATLVHATKMPGTARQIKSLARAA
jgi:hypothetical protein